jgi:hypothetical protein
MAASSNKQMKDLLTDEDMSKDLDIEDESDIFSEESYDFWFDTSEEDSDRDSDTSSVVHESEPHEEVLDFLQPSVPHGVACTRFAFLGVSGVNVDFDDEINIVECFQKFIDEDMCQLFAEQTNIYANQFLVANPNLKSRYQAKCWMDTSPTEMKTLIELLILHGIVQKPENGMYFSKRGSIVMPYFPQIMTEKRFHLLLKLLFLLTIPKFTPISITRNYKIRPILDHLKPKFSSTHTQQNETSVSTSLSSSGRDDWLGFSMYHQSEAGLE